MKKRIMTVLLIGAATTAPLAANDAKQPPNQARVGQLMTVQMMTDDTARFLREWSQAPTPRIKVVSKTERNKPIHTVIIFAGCKGDANGKCNLTADFEIIRPSGPPSPDDIRRNVPISVGRDARTDNNFVVGSSFLGFAAEDKDPLGVYRVRTAVTDHVAQVTATTENSFEVVASPAQ